MTAKARHLTVKDHTLAMRAIPGGAAGGALIASTTGAITAAVLEAF